MLSREPRLTERPRLCYNLPGTGGAYKVTPEDFVVEEIAAYEPSGTGQHTFLWIEKRGLATPQAMTALARALGASAERAGCAGMKDKQALTRQWISLEGVDPALALALADAVPGVRVLDARRHGNKLRTGHLRGNRFSIIVRGACADATVRTGPILARLAELGLPNFYGDQRFGRAGDNAARGRALLSGELRVRDRRERRLLVSALQAELFNAVLVRRMSEGSYARALRGDVMSRIGSGGLFRSTDPDTDQIRMRSWEIQPTGPMFGAQMMTPETGSEPDRLERETLDAAGLDEAFLARAGTLAEGTRRELSVRPEGLRAEACADGTLRLECSLPAGAYATVLLHEVIG
jgi:tRNA pseudouridine13 synthase